MHRNKSPFTCDSTISKMNNTIIEGDDASDALYGVSAVYLVIVAISGGAFNIMAFVRAIKVSLTGTHMKQEIIIHEVFWSTSFANYQIQRFLMLGKKNRNAPHLNQPHCQWPCNHIHWYPCWCTWGVYKRIRFGHVFVSVGCICTHNVRFVKIYNIFINLLGNVNID